MRIHRFFGEFDFSQPTVFIDDVNLINQLKNVLRRKQGDIIILCDGKKNEAEGIIEKIEKKRWEIKIQKIKKNDSESERNIVLYVSVLKRENFELVAQKVVEAGVSRIVPIRAEHTVKQNIHRERIKKIMKEAAEQSGRGIISELCEIENFKDAIKEDGVIYVFDSSGVFVDMKARDFKKPTKLFIGPEGGWTEEELNLAKEYKARVVSLGKHTLRAETAAIVASYLFANL